jgi:hypothetical protein
VEKDEDNSIQLTERKKLSDVRKIDWWKKENEREREKNWLTGEKQLLSLSG